MWDKERNRYIKLYRYERIYSNIGGEIISCDKKFDKFKSSATSKCVMCVILENLLNLIKYIVLVIKAIKK